MNSLLRFFRIFYVLVFGASFLQAFSQTYVPRAERGDYRFRRSSILEANNVRTTIFNYGLSGRSGAYPNEIPYEWPKGTHRNYLALNGLFVGGEVTDADGNLIHIVDVSAYRVSPTGQSWNFEPVPEYLQSPFGVNYGIAQSDQQWTWPDIWPDKMTDTADPGWRGTWNGFLGKNNPIHGVEMYSHFSDDRYDRYRYFPDSTDSTRKGLGIVVGRRTMEFTDDLVNDAVVFVDDIYNPGTNDIPKTAVTYWLADMLGGDGDAQDDHAWYNGDTTAIYFTDQDGRGNKYFGDDPVGAMGFAFLQTPSTPKISRFQYLRAGSIIFSSTADIYFWATFMMPPPGPDYMYDPSINRTGDFDGFATPELFPLPAGSSRRVISAVVLGADTAEVGQKIEYLRTYMRNGCSNNNIAVTTPYPYTHDTVLSGLSTIRWNAAANDPSLHVDIYASSDAGSHWQLLARNHANTGAFDWNTTQFPDGIMNLLKIVAYDSLRLGSIRNAFSINNSGVSTPQMEIIRPVACNCGESWPLRISYFAGNADSAGVTLTLLYGYNGVDGWDTLATMNVPNGMGDYLWDQPSLPVSSNYYIKAIVASGSSTASTVNGPFGLGVQRYDVASDTQHVHRSTIGTGTIEVHVMDTTQLNGHAYEVNFKAIPGDTVYDVTDMTVHQTVLENVRNNRGITEGPAFDGMRLLIIGDTISWNSARTNWKRDSIAQLTMNVFKSGFVQGTPEADDYLIAIGDLGIDTSLRLSFGATSLPARPVNFSVSSRSTGQKVPFAFWERSGDDGIFSVDASNSDVIILLKQSPGDSLVPTWQISMWYNTVFPSPRSGDSAILVTRKPFLPGDRFSFTALTPGAIMGVGRSLAHPDYHLEQNYPNPFNPTTDFGYRTPDAGFVTLKIFNLLGQEVAALVNGVKSPGEYHVQWNASAMPSGVYFYRLDAASTANPTKRFSETKKMLLVK